MNKKINGVSLFANGGIAETYMYKHNIDIVVANEIIKKRADFYQSRFPKSNMICGDITEVEVYKRVLEEALDNKCDFVIATPPCQSMSLMNRMSSQEDKDVGNLLITYAVNFIADLSPNYAIIENVQQILTTYIDVFGKKTLIKDYIINTLEPMGYTVVVTTLNAKDYGTPQSRKRTFFLISKKGKWILPKKEKEITVREAIRHLPSLPYEEDGIVLKHHSTKKEIDRYIQFMKHTPSGKSGKDNPIHYPKKENGERLKGFSTTYSRLDWNKPCTTITTNNGNVSSSSSIHPGYLKVDGTYSDCRVLSLREIFILTGLPEEWDYPKGSSENLVRTIVGEGIPPILIDKILKGMPRCL